jgi:hypothetical protein
MLALLAIALPQTPNQFFIYTCMVGLLGVLGTLLHCLFFYYCICMVLRGETD